MINDKNPPKNLSQVLQKLLVQQWQKIIRLCVPIIIIPQPSCFVHDFIEREQGSKRFQD